ncbi:MAG: UDP-N-acetylmuramate dehydrogenase [Chloroflexi bacterium]|nr:UDP-N-acetylmuramate dehydrogenase [Chloroflexota bacterium]
MNAAALAEQIGAPVRSDEPLARHCSWRVGGPAEFFVAAGSVAVLKRAVLAARAAGIGYRVLGRGTNVLVSDRGLRGLVIAAECDGYELAERDDVATLYAETGGSLPQLANTVSRRGWAGLEWAVGIPSAIGAAVVNNCGAHGACMADCVVSATVLDGAGAERTLDTAALGFGYRTSRFKGRQDEIVLAATMKLVREAPEAVIERLRKHNEYRRATQPPEPSAGSVFKNPPGDYAGRLIDAAGLKGARVGGALVSPVHANFFVNAGGATAGDLLTLIRLVQVRVRERFGVTLETEIELLGEWQAQASGA